MTRQPIPTHHAVIVVVPMGHNAFVLVEESKPGFEGQWSLPGGMLEPGESVASVAVREVREEAGIEVEPVGILRIEHTRYTARATEPSEKFRFIVLARHLSGDLKRTADREPRRAAAFSLTDARSLKLRDGYDLAWLSDAGRGTLLPMSAYEFIVR